MTQQSILQYICGEGKENRSRPDDAEEMARAGVGAPETGDANECLATAIRAPVRSQRGLAPWHRGRGQPSVKVHHVRLTDLKAPELDGREVATVSGDTVRFEPLKHGTTVLVAGMGWGKTWRVIQWYAKRKGTPLVVVTARRNLAGKIEADLKRKGIDCHNYLNTPDGFLFTGPYMVDTFSAGAGIDLVPNPYYPNADQRPDIELIKYRSCVGMVP